MDFSFTRCQQELRSLTAEVLDSSPGPVAWQALADAGVLEACLPEYGGGAVTTTLVLREIGRRRPELPGLSCLGIAMPVLARHAGLTQRRVLDDVISGQKLVTAAVREHGRPDPCLPGTRARADGTHFVLDGTKIAVAAAEQSWRVLVPAAVGGAGAGVFLLDPRSGGVELTLSRPGCLEPEYRMRMDSVRLDATSLLSNRADGEVARFLHRCAVLAACAVAGGVLAGCAEVASTALDLVVRTAAWQLDSGRAVDDHLSAAAVWLCTKGLAVMPPGHPGFTAVRHLAGSLGGAAGHLDLLGAACSSN